MVNNNDDEAFEVLESEIEKMGDRKEAGTEVAEEDTETDTAGASTEAAGEDGRVDRDRDP